MPYLNLDLDFFEHPKTLRIIGLVGHGGGELVLRLWAKAGKFYPRNGRFDGYTDGEIEALIGWWGAAGAGVFALLRAGFLERIEGGFVVHDWKKHEGHIWALKVRNEKVAKARWNKIRDGKTADTKRVPVVHQDSNPGMPQTIPNHPSKPSIPNLNGITEESVRMPWGEFKGVRVVDLEASYCGWLLKNKLDAVRATKKDTRLEAALRSRVSEKAAEAAR